MTLKRRSFLISAGAASIASVTHMTPALAQDYPLRGPIKILVPTGVGGGLDIVARITADFLQRRIGQAIVVENKPGAAGEIGAAQVWKSPSDGYTLAFQGSDFSARPAVRKNLPYKPEEFTYLMRCFTIPTLVFGSPSLPVNTVPELIAHMRANPGKVSYGSSGTGGVIHLALALLEESAGVRGIHVPFPGLGAAYAAMLGGHLDFVQGVVPFPQGLKVLGTAGTKRHPQYPNLPTLEESGVRNASWDVWYGLMAPPNLPKPIQDLLIKEMKAVMQDPVAIEKFTSVVGFAPDPIIGDDFRKSTLGDLNKWKTVANARQIVLDS